MIARLANTITQFESRFAIGDPIWLEAQGKRLAGYVRAVTFSSGKVRYAVQLELASGLTTLHNVDSAVISVRPGISVEYGFDNYS